MWILAAVIIIIQRCSRETFKLTLYSQVLVFSLFYSHSLSLCALFFWRWEGYKRLVVRGMGNVGGILKRTIADNFICNETAAAAWTQVSRGFSQRLARLSAFLPLVVVICLEPSPAVGLDCLLVVCCSVWQFGVVTVLKTGFPLSVCVYKSASMWTLNILN